MNYPLISEYIEAIKLAEDNFDQLSSLRPVLDSNGNPIMSSGNFAVVFKMKDINTGKLHAVKCFIKDQEERNERYAMIAAELEQVKSPYILPIHFLEKELFVDTSQSDETEFPVLVMDWVEGKTLDAYLRENLNNQYRLQMLAYRFCQMSTWLMSQPFAHGDLKPDNILVREDGSLVLVDYDGFYVPAMKGQEARELGSPDFHHPQRTPQDFDEHIDDFSIATIALSFKAISIDAQLYHNYAASDRLLLSANDYHDIGSSKTMQRITQLASDPELAMLIGAFYIALSNKTLKKMSNNVFDIKMPATIIGEGKTIITREDVKQVKEKYVELINVVIADSVASIGYSAFSGCTSLQNIVIPESVTEIGWSAFEGCTSLQSITIPESVTTIEDCTFSKCSLLQSITIPEGVTEIGVSAFEDCASLKEIVIPESVTEIEECAFEGCTSLQSIVVAEGNKKYDSREGCNAIIETATNTLISGCAKTIIPEGITEIGVSAFEDCASLKEIVIPESVTEIEECAFEGCTSLQSIVVAEGNKKYDSREGCNAIIETATNTLILGCAKTIIPESVTVIGTDAFFRCTSLQSITIPKSVMEIGYYAFEGCTSLQSIVIPGSVTEIRFRTFCGCTSLQSITIPESVTKIGSGAFSGCTSLQSITIPEGVTEIGSSAFSGCTSLQNIVIPESVTEIGWSAFEGCTSLQSITIPNSVTLIGTWAFYDCTGLTSVTLSKSITEIGIGVFDRCVNLEYINIPKGTRIKFEKLLDQNLHSKLVEM